MVKSVHDILARLLPMLLALAMSSCGDNSEPALPPSTADYSFSFYISMGDAAEEGETRAPADGTYHPGQGFENFINLAASDVRVILYDTDNKLISEVTEFVVMPVESYQSSKRWYLRGTTKSDLSSGRFKIAVLANWGTYPAALTLADVWQQTYTYKGPQLSENNTIPLYGIKECAVGPVEADTEIKIGTIHLLRALAKIEVILKNGKSEDDTEEHPLPENDFWHFKYLKLSHYNKSGFNAPTDVDSEDEYVKNAWGDDYVTNLSIPKDVERGTDLDFVPTTTNHWVVYVPEYNNNAATNAVPQATINFEFAESGTAAPHPVTISDSQGKPLDFKRNVWYRLTIYKHKEQSELVVDVMPFKNVKLDPIFGLDTEETKKEQ